MTATEWERDLARTNGVVLRTGLAPTAFEGNGAVTAVRFGDVVVAADMVLKAIGQKLDASVLGDLKLDGGKLWVDAVYQTSLPGVYAGGDAIQSGEDLTVQAVEDGKRAAIAADIYVRGA